MERSLPGTGGKGFLDREPDTLKEKSEKPGIVVLIGINKKYRKADKVSKKTFKS